jgi:hypothetical protein
MEIHVPNPKDGFFGFLKIITECENVLSSPIILILLLYLFLVMFLNFGCKSKPRVVIHAISLKVQE